MSYRSRYQIADSQQFQSVLTSDPDVNSVASDPLTQEWDLLSYRAPEIDENGRKCDRYPWMQVSVHSEEVMRTTGGAPALAPILTTQEIRNAGQLYSALGVRLILSDDTQESRVVDVDIAGGFTFTWAGSGVAVKVRTQANGAPIREIRETAEGVRGLTGVIIVDDIVGASVTVGGVGFETGSGGGGSLSPSCLKLSQCRHIDAASLTVFAMPSGACRMTLYAQTPGDVTAQWLAFFQGPEAAPAVAAGPAGEIPAIAIVASASVDVPGCARALVVSNTGVEQNITVVWDIEL